MKAKDSVMNDEQIERWCKEHQKDTNEEFCSTSPSSCYACLCEAQAIISFKAGIKEAMENLAELHIDIGIASNDNYEYGEHGSIVFYIPHYKVKVNLSRGNINNVTPTFTYNVGSVCEDDKKLVSSYCQLPPKT